MCRGLIIFSNSLAKNITSKKIFSDRYYCHVYFSLAKMFRGETLACCTRTSTTCWARRHSCSSVHAAWSRLDRSRHNTDYLTHIHRCCCCCGENCTYHSVRRNIKVAVFVLDVWVIAVVGCFVAIQYRQAQCCSVVQVSSSFAVDLSLILIS